MTYQQAKRKAQGEAKEGRGHNTLVRRVGGEYRARTNHHSFSRELLLSSLCPALAEFEDGTGATVWEDPPPDAGETNLLDARQYTPGMET